MLRLTPRTALSPPNDFDRPLSSSTHSSAPSLRPWSLTGGSRWPWQRLVKGGGLPRWRGAALYLPLSGGRYQKRAGSLAASLAEFARREVAAVHRLLEESLLAVRPELAHGRIGLDHRVPQLFLVVAEHL